MGDSQPSAPTPAQNHEAANRRFYLQDCMTFDTVDGPVTVGKGWLLISEEEYRALPPAKLDAPYNQEALAGEGVEGLPYAERVQYEERILAAEMLAARLKRLIRKPDALGAYKGDVFYPVGGTVPSHWWDGQAWQWLSELELDPALSCTPSSPQAEVADVERVAEIIREHVHVRFGCQVHGIDDAARALSTMTTRPAGVEEVGRTAGKAWSVSISKGTAVVIEFKEQKDAFAHFNAATAALTRQQATEGER